MKVIIAGGRNFNDYGFLVKTIESSGFNITEVISGGARGADFMGEWWSLDNLNKKATVFPANWDKFGKSAGPIRNAEMGQYAEALIAVWDGYSKGTAHMIDYMRFLNKPYYVGDY